MIRLALTSDLEQLLVIYNQGIEDRIATLEVETKNLTYMENWFTNRTARHPVIVFEEQNQILGWGSINPYNLRDAYIGVGEVSVYIERLHRGKGIGQKILNELEVYGRNYSFHKLILFTFPLNELGQGLYRKMGYREVGVFKNQGILDGRYVDVMAMEKLLSQ